MKHFFQTMILVSSLFSYGMSETGDKVLYAAVTSGAPVIDKSKKTICYSMDLVFDEAPSDYWVYYSTNRKMLVLDLYGNYINGKSRIDLSERGVFKSVTIENRETKMSLSRKQSNVLIEMEADTGWHIDAENSDKKTVHITACKGTGNLSRIENQNSKAAWVAVLSLLAASLVVVGIAIFRE